MRFAPGTLLAVCIAARVACGAEAESSRVYEIDLPAQSVAQALNGLSAQTGMPVMFPYGLAKSRTTNSVVGRYTLRDALAAMLRDTGLSGGLSEKGVLTISATGSRANTTGEANLTQYKKTDIGGENGASKPTRIAAFFASIAAAFSASAQTSGEGSTPTASEPPKLEEIIVTSQKRRENLQEVPVAISAFTADALNQRGVETMEDLQQYVPGLNVGANNRDMGIITLRGVGLSNETLGGDPGVTLYMDGHYLQSASFLVQDFLDVERVEVARGPQGTLYGRNSIGGVMNVVTKRPTEELEGTFTVDLGSFDKRLVTGAIGGPFSDRIRGRLAASSEKRDGYVKNTVGPDLKASEYYSVRAALDADVTDQLTMSVGGYYFDDTGNTFVRQFLRDPSTRRVSQNGPFDRDSKAKGASVDFSWNLGALELRSLSAWNDSAYAVSQDFDGNATGVGLLQQSGATETFTQELQLVSPTDQALRWVAGAFYYTETSDFTFRVNNLPALLVSVGPSLLKSDSKAVFGQTQYSINEQWELILGLRYSKDRKSNTAATVFLQQNGNVVVPGGFRPITYGDWAAWTGQAGVNYHLSADKMLYASFSRGYKTGGFNAGILQFPTYEPEYVDASEIGLKSEWLDSRLQANIAVFNYDYKDKQETTSILFGAATLTYLSNAAAARIRGAEFEAIAQPTRALRLNASFGYLDAKFLDFFSIDSLNPAAGLQNVSGNVIPKTSKYKFSLGGEYRFELGTLGRLTPRIDYAWTDRVQFANFSRNADWIASYGRINARVQWQSASSKWTAELYGQNLADEMTVVNSYPQADGNNEVFYLAPRTYGLKVRYDF